MLNKVIMTRGELEQTIEQCTTSRTTKYAILNAVDKYISSQNSGKPLVSGSLPPNEADRVQLIVNRAVLETGLSEDEVIGYMLYVLKGKEIREFGGNDR